MKINNHLFSIVLVCVMLIAGFVLFTKKADAQAALPFAGQLIVTQVCCNGIEFTLTNQYATVARGMFIFPWYNMIPLPFVGTGLYEWYNVTYGANGLGRASTGGSCTTIYSECEASTPDQFTVLEMGTNTF